MRGADQVFDLSQSRPFSVSTQLARSTALGECLKAEGADGEMLVVGAGISGVFLAAIVATGRRRVVLADRSEDARLFPVLQAPRDLDLNLYRWPADGWTGGALDGPFGVEPGPAREVAGNLAVFVTEALKAVSIRRPAPVSLSDHRRWAGTLYDSVVVAIGPGKERLTPDVGDFLSLGFWDPNDPVCAYLAEGTGSVPHASSLDHQVLISGAGDGGLQDLIQVCTLSTVRDFLREMDPDGDLALQAARVAQAFPSETSCPHTDNAWYRAAGEYLETAPKVRARLDELRHRVGNVRVVVRGPCLPGCFALNRILACLLRYVDPDLFCYETDVTGVECPAASCGPTAVAHLERAHKVTATGKHGAALSRDWRFVYLRHGIRGPVSGHDLLAGLIVGPGPQCGV